MSTRPRSSRNQPNIEIDATPPLLAVSTGHEVRDIAEAVVRVRPDAVERARRFAVEGRH